MKWTYNFRIQEVTEEILKPVYFKPDIEIEQTKEDYINGIDTVLSYTFEMLNSKNYRIRKAG